MVPQAELKTLQDLLLMNAPPSGPRDLLGIYEPEIYKCMGG
jgi:hypothetical protein